jgi:hypothetical protein
VDAACLIWGSSVSVCIDCWLVSHPSPFIGETHVVILTSGVVTFLSYLSSYFIIRNYVYNKGSTDHRALSWTFYPFPPASDPKLARPASKIHQSYAPEEGSSTNLAPVYPSKVLIGPSDQTSRVRPGGRQQGEKQGYKSREIKEAGNEELQSNTPLFPPPVEHSFFL